MFIRLPVFPPRTNFFSPIFLPSPLLFILFSFALQLVLQLLSPGPSFFRTVLSVRVILFPWLGNAIGKSGRSMINRGRRWRQDWRPVTRDFWRRRREEEEEENRGEFGSWFTRLQRFSLAGKRYWWLGAATYVPAIGSLQVRLGNSLVCAATIPFKWKLLLSWSLLRVYIYIYIDWDIPDPRTNILDRIWSRLVFWTSTSRAPKIYRAIGTLRGTHLHASISKINPSNINIFEKKKKTLTRRSSKIMNHSNLILCIRSDI